MEQEKDKRSRRRFLENGMASGLSLALGWSAAKSMKETDTEKVKLITADGKLVEVERRFLPEKSGKRLSNEELKKWMGSG